jgi:uncharacterized protein (TIGR00290 family)
VPTPEAASSSSPHSGETCSGREPAVLPNDPVPLPTPTGRIRGFHYVAPEPSGSSWLGLGCVGGSTSEECFIADKSRDIEHHRHESDRELAKSMKERALLSWSSGKDSAWSLHVLREQNEVEVVGLLTTLNAEYDRVAMHAVRSELLRKQADAAGLELWPVPIPWPCSNEDYEAAMAAAMNRAARAGVTRIAFGDLFLEDIRRYRIERLAGTGITPLFPVWGIPTNDLARRMIEAGLRARLTCVDPRKLDASFAGRDFDATLLHDLPPSVDPCGENGEFHSFAYDGPMFRCPVAVRRGEVVERDGFVFADLLPE